jgi:hypothetical protein
VQDVLNSAGRLLEVHGLLDARKRWHSLAGKRLWNGDRHLCGLSQCAVHRGLRGKNERHIPHLITSEGKARIASVHHDNANNQLESIEVIQENA